jgi:mono/diheme cytochrome c family protein
MENYSAGGVMSSTKTSSVVVRSILFLFAVVALSACGSARRSEPIAGPMDVSSASLQRGRAVFDSQCYSCHLDGAGGMAPAFNDKPLPKALVRFQVRHGLGAMPAFSKEEISDSELDDLANYVVALRRHGK